MGLEWLEVVTTKCLSLSYSLNECVDEEYVASPYLGLSQVCFDSFFEECVVEEDVADFYQAWTARVALALVVSSKWALVSS